MFQTPPPEGARVLACFYDVWYLATVLAVHSSDDVEVRWESEESRSHVGLKDLRRIGDPVQDFANIVPWHGSVTNGILGRCASYAAMLCWNGGDPLGLRVFHQSCPFS